MSASSAGGRRLSPGCLLVGLIFGLLVVPVAGLVGLLWFLTALLSDASLPGPGRTVVLVAIDDLRADHLASHGYPHGATPTLDAWAREGQVLRGHVPASVATAPQVASLLSGLQPFEHGLVSQRDPSSARLPRAVDTLAEGLREAGWMTLGAVSVRQLSDRLCALDQGFGAWMDQAPASGAPRPAADVAGELVDLLRYVPDDVFAFLHLGDLRQEGTASDFLEAHFAPLAGSDPDLDAALARLESDPGGALAQLEEVIGRRRGSPGWLALRRARYDAQLAAVDAALARLAADLEDLGRGDAQWIVVGTRGRFLAESRPPQATPEAFAEALLRTPCVIRGLDLGLDSDAPVDSARVGAALAAHLLDRVPPAPRPAQVTAAGQAEVARVDAEHVVTGYGRRVYRRADEVELPQAWEQLAFEPPQPPGWSIGVENGALEAVLRSPVGPLVLEQDGGSTPGGPRLVVSLRPGASGLSTVRRRVPVILELEPGERRAALGPGPLGLFPRRPDPQAPARARAVREGSRWRVSVDAQADQQVDLWAWAYPPADLAAPLDAEAGPGVVSLTSHAGRDLVVARGRGPIEVLLGTRARQDLALWVSVEGRDLEPAEISLEGGLDAETLALYLAPESQGAEVFLEGGPTLRLRRRYLGAAMVSDPASPDLSAEEIGFLSRLGPLE